MVILEEIAVSASKLAETGLVILITNWQHKTAGFRGVKPALLGVLAGFGGEWYGGGAAKTKYVNWVCSIGKYVWL